MGRSNSPTAFGPTRTAEVGTAVSNLNPHIHPTRRTSRSTEMISQNRSTLAGLCLLFLGRANSWPGFGCVLLAPGLGRIPHVNRTRWFIFASLRR